MNKDKTLEYLMNPIYNIELKKSNSINKNYSKEIKFYKKRILRMFKNMLKGESTDENIKHAYDNYIKLLIEHFKMIDTNDIIQKEYNIENSCDNMDDNMDENVDENVDENMDDININDVQRVDENIGEIDYEMDDNNDNNDDNDDNIDDSNQFKNINNLIINKIKQGKNTLDKFVVINKLNNEETIPFKKKIKLNEPSLRYKGIEMLEKK